MYCYNSKILEYINKKEPYCYNLRLGSGCNLGKDLSWEIEKSQLVKCKDTGLYLQLYIPKDYEENIHYTWGNESEKIKKSPLLHEVLTDYIWR